MANKLAKLDDLKTALRVDSDGIDAELTTLLETAASISERVAGVVDGGLRRTVDQTFYPITGANSRITHLDRRPLESISSVKLLYSSSTPDEFDAETSLVEGMDFYLDTTELSGIGLYNLYWSPAKRSNQVIATTGFADPDDAVGGSSIEPPEDLQRGNVMQAVQLYNLRNTAGLKGIQAGGASGQLGHVQTHPMLEQAASRYRRHFL